MQRRPYKIHIFSVKTTSFYLLWFEFIWISSPKPVCYPPSIFNTVAGNWATSGDHWKELAANCLEAEPPGQVEQQHPNSPSVYRLADINIPTLGLGLDWHSMTHDDGVRLHISTYGTPGNGTEHRLTQSFYLLTFKLAWFNHYKTTELHTGIVLQTPVQCVPCSP